MYDPMECRLMTDEAECGVCKGNGYLSGVDRYGEYGNQECPECGGDGFVLLKVPEPDDEGFTLSWQENRLACLILLWLAIAFVIGLCGLLVVVMT